MSPVVMDNLPSYYLPGSRLSVKLVDGGSDADVSFTIVSAFTPFTMSQVFLVESDSEEERGVVNFIVKSLYFPINIKLRFFYVFYLMGFSWSTRCMRV